MLKRSVESFLVVSESFSPTNSVINPPETNGFLTGARLGAVVTTGISGLSVMDSAVKGAVVVATVDAGEDATIVWADGVTGVCVGTLNFMGATGSTRGEGPRARREAAPVIKPGISSEEAEDSDDGDDWRSMSTVSDDTGLICDVLLPASSMCVHGASSFSTGACRVVDAVDEGLPGVAVADAICMSGISVRDGLRGWIGDWGGVLGGEPMLIGDRLRGRSSSGIYSG